MINPPMAGCRRKRHSRRSNCLVVAGASLLSFAFLVATAQADDSPSITSIDFSTIPPSFIPNFLPGANEEIADALCTMDDLERANDSQLNIIFKELQQTNFFQHFVVDLEHKCNILKDDTKKAAPKKAAAKKGAAKKAAKKA